MGEGCPRWVYRVIDARLENDIRRCRRGIGISFVVRGGIFVVAGDIASGSIEMEIVAEDLGYGSSWNIMQRNDCVLKLSYYTRS